MMYSSSNKETSMRTTAAIIVGVALLATTAWAQPDAQHKTPAKTVAKKSVQKHKSAAVKSIAGKAVAAPQPQSAPVAAVAEPALGQEELSIAQRVHHGSLPCELGATVRVDPDQIQPGYFNVHGKGFRYRMHPVATSTGAIRLEDKQAGAVWLQLANKSMLMDQKKGQRLADECANPDQMAYAAQMKTNPPPALFDTTGMGR